MDQPRTTVDFDDVNDIIRCRICSKLYTMPVTLPCGETICQAHLNEFEISRDKKFKCDLCTDEHILPENGFQANKAIQKMLDINIDRLDRGEAFKNAKAAFETLNSKFETYELINTVPAFFIDEYFSNVINEIDLRRDEIKLEIDNHYDKLINDLKLTQKQCVIMSEANRRVSTDELKQFRKEVDLFNKDLKMLDLAEHKLKNIETKSKILVNKIEFKLKEIKDFFLLSKSFSFKQPEVKIDANVLGSLEIKTSENLLNFNKEIMKLKQDFQNKLAEGSSKKYKITNYDDIKTWSECSEHVQRQHKIDDQIIKNILSNTDQSDHLKFINGVENTKKNYTVVTSAELNNEEGCYFFRILKDFNPQYSHEFLNDLGFLILVKNPKFEKI